jgi:hypothetical protein
MSNTQIYREVIEVKIEKQSMPPSHTKEKVWGEIISDTPEKKIIKVHDSIEGKRCQVCDKELEPDKIVWCENQSMCMAFSPKTGKMDKEKIYISEYGMCSEECKKVLVRVLKENAEKLDSFVGIKGSVISHFERSAQEPTH